MPCLGDGESPTVGAGRSEQVKVAGVRRRQVLGLAVTYSLACLFLMGYYSAVGYRGRMAYVAGLWVFMDATILVSYLLRKREQS